MPVTVPEHRNVQQAASVPGRVFDTEASRPEGPGLDMPDGVLARRKRRELVRALAIAIPAVPREHVDDSLRSAASRIRESEAGVPGGSFGQRRGEHTGKDVVVVVDLGGGLAGVGPQDSPGVLDDASLEGDRATRNRVSRAGQSKPSPTYEPVATTRSAGPPGTGVRR
jgi:hypothetical protein